MLRVGVAGVGNLGKLHAGTLLNMPDKVSVDALADPIEERRLGGNLKTEGLNLGLGADEAATAGTVRSYNDYTELCTDPALDAVFIATPSDLHADGVVKALESGKHVFTEKPMALTAEDCRRMIDASLASGKTLMVGQVLRFYPAYVKAREIMQAGTYGNVLTAIMNRHGGRPGGWFAELARSGGVCLDLHIHDVDAALWWWGEPDVVHRRTMGSVDTAMSVLSQWEYKAGPVVQIEASWDAGIPFGGYFRIMMEHATLDGREGLKLITREGTETLALSGPGGHAAEVHYFVQCLLDGVPVARCLPAESMRAVRYAI